MKRRKIADLQSNNERDHLNQTNFEIFTIPLEIWGEIFEFIAGENHVSACNWYLHNSTYYNLCLINRQFLSMMRIDPGYPNLSVFKSYTNYLAVLPNKIKRIHIEPRGKISIPLLTRIPTTISSMQIDMTNDLYDILSCYIFKTTTFSFLSEVIITFETSILQPLRLFAPDKCPNMKKLSIHLMGIAELREVFLDHESWIPLQLESLKIMCSYITYNLDKIPIPSMKKYTNLKCLYFDFFVKTNEIGMSNIKSILEPLPPNLHTFKGRCISDDINCINYITNTIKKARFQILSIHGRLEKIPSHLESLSIKQPILQPDAAFLLPELPKQIFTADMSLKKLKIESPNSIFDRLITDYHISTFPKILQDVTISGCSIRDINCIYYKIKHFRLYNCTWQLWKNYLLMAVNKRRDDVISSNEQFITTKCRMNAGKYTSDESLLGERYRYISHKEDTRGFRQLLQSLEL